MSVLLVLVVVLPIIFLFFGVLLGAYIHKFWFKPSPCSQISSKQTGEDARCPTSCFEASEAQLHSINIVASGASIRDEDFSAFPSKSFCSSPIVALPDLADSLQPSPVASPVGHIKHARNSSDLCRLMRAGTSVLSQVMEDMDTHSALRRLMSERIQCMPSPQGGVVPSSPPGGAMAMPPGEVHMDEIDLQECIGKGGFGAVYTARWRQAPVAVKYIVCRTDNHDSLGRAIREVVLSKKMSHPNVVQCYSWTILTQPEKAQDEPFSCHPQPALASNSIKRSLDLSFCAAEGGTPEAAEGEQSTTPGTNPSTPPREGPSSETPAASLQPSPFADAATPQPDHMPPVHVKQSCADPGAGKSTLAELVYSHITSSPAIAAVRPEDLVVLEAAAVAAVLGQASCCGADAQVTADASAVPGLHARAPEAVSKGSIKDAETPAVAPSLAAAPAGTNHSFEDALLAQFQQIASELCLSRSSSLKLSHHSTGSSSFSDVHHGFMLGESNRTETQQSASESGWISRQGSAGSSLTVTPSAAAAENPHCNPFRRSRLARAVSSVATCSEAPAASEQMFGAHGKHQRIAESSHSAAMPGCKDEDVPVSVGIAHLDLPASETAAPKLVPSSLKCLAAEAAWAGCISGGNPPSAAALSQRSTSSGGVLPVAAEASTEQDPALQSSSVLSLSAWQHRTSADGGASKATGGTLPCSAQPITASVLIQSVAAPLPLQLWRPETIAPSLSTLPRIPSRLGPRPNLGADAPPSPDPPTLNPISAANHTAAIPLGSPPPSPPTALQGAVRGPERLPGGAAAELSAAAAAALLEGGLSAHPRRSIGSLRGSPKTGGSVPGEFKVASRESSRSGRKQRRVNEVLEEELVVDSRTDSFNSEEGFGSPVRQRCGGVKSVFELEGLDLSCQEALMVVVMEYCDLGSLQKAIKRRAFVPRGKWTFQLTYRALLRTAQEIAKGMEYIHDNDVVHGDLKPGNVLLKTHKVDRRGYIAKVSDFGLSRPINNGETHISLGNALGTIAYTSPEVFITNIVRKPSDVYSFGIMLWEMFHCTDVYDGLIDGQICMGVSDGALRPEFDASCPWPYRSLAERCWHQDPDKRPTFREIVRELFNIEVDFRNLTRRNNSKCSRPGSLPSSLANSRPPSPDLPLRRKSRGVEADFARALMA